MDNYSTDYKKPVDKEWVQTQFYLYNKHLKEYLDNYLSKYFKDIANIKENEKGELIFTISKNSDNKGKIRKLILGSIEEQS